MKEKWNKLSKPEKGLTLLIIVLLLAIAINWSRVYNGLKQGMVKYKNNETEQTEPPKQQ
ncbi:MAG: hypothetical protein PF489_13670 [Salinivirgaceae bacterium]|jgi:cell division protein FtsL|nr:hypothetical protein [Salinivirgaceae bacterium]